MDVTRVENPNQKEICEFCYSNEVDEIKFGPLYKYKTLVTHYYCMLLSPNLVQNSDNCEDGLFGFFLTDIRKELKRAKNLTCSFCKKKGASLGCVIKTCRARFHLPCGLNNGTMHQFWGTYNSFCRKHQPHQTIECRGDVDKDPFCNICYESISAQDQTLWAPCCKKNTLFHRSCIQRLALNAGYFFRCPLCNNEDIFRTEMKTFGIFIPEQDASWELVPRAYEDLLQRHDTCDSVTCHCGTGRKTDEPSTQWELILCKYCGSRGTHVLCGHLNMQCPEYICEDCSGGNVTPTRSPDKKKRKIMKESDVGSLPSES